MVLTDLNLGDNDIRDEGAAAIAEALRGNGVLKSIDLSRNRLDAEAGKALASALEKNAVLKKIDLRGSNLGDAEHVCYTHLRAHEPGRKLLWRIVL